MWLLWTLPGDLSSSRQLFRQIRHLRVADLILNLLSRQETSPLWAILLFICICSGKIKSLAWHQHGEVLEICLMDSTVCFHRRWITEQSLLSCRYWLNQYVIPPSIKKKKYCNQGWFFFFHFHGLKSEGWNKPNPSALAEQQRRTAVCIVGETVCVHMCVGVCVKCTGSDCYPTSNACSALQWALSLTDSIHHQDMGQSVAKAKTIQWAAICIQLTMWRWRRRWPWLCSDWY